MVLVSGSIGLSLVGHVSKISHGQCLRLTITRLVPLNLKDVLIRSGSDWRSPPHSSQLLPALPSSMDGEDDDHGGGCHYKEIIEDVWGIGILPGVLFLRYVRPRACYRLSQLDVPLKPSTLAGVRDLSKPLQDREELLFHSVRLWPQEFDSSFDDLHVEKPVGRERVISLVVICTMFILIVICV